MHLMVMHLMMHLMILTMHTHPPGCAPRLVGELLHAVLPRVDGALHHEEGFCRVAAGTHALVCITMVYSFVFVQT